MSGTSLDGVDAAVLVTDGRDILSFGPVAYRAYTRPERGSIAAALGRWQGPEVQAAAAVVEAAHEALLSGFGTADVIGFHGQTVAHAPRHKGTLQVGDGAALADAMKTPVVWDFRRTDIEMGGEGAPLASFFHHACARHAGLTGPVAFLNLGGVGNLTWVDPTIDDPQIDGALIAFDTGPANAPINDLLQARQGVAFDKGGAQAAAGEVAQGALELFLSDPYFSRVPPKSLDRDDFAEMVKLVQEMSDANAAATLTAMAAAAVAVGMEHCPRPPERVFVTGGGRHNPVLMEMLRVSLDCPVVPVEEIGLNGDMLEALAFGYLAVRVARGLPTTAPGTTGVRVPVGGGVVSLPSTS